MKVYGYWLSWPGEVMKEADVSAITGLARDTLKAARRTPDVPPHTKTASGHIVYARRDVEAWKRDHIINVEPKPKKAPQSTAPPPAPRRRKAGTASRPRIEVL